MKRIVKLLAFVSVIIATFFAFSLTANACEITSDTTDANGVRQIVLAPTGEEEPTIVIKRIVRECMDNPLELTFTPGDYHMSSIIAMFNNTTINAEGATIYQDTPGKGFLINARYVDSVFGNGKAGYSSLENVVVNGGTWVGKAKPDTTKTKKPNGYYVGYSSFLFMHAQNITIQNCSFVNNYNGHFIELAGVKDANIINCNMNVEGSQYIGEGSNEAIQIDNTYQKSNSPVGAPWDDTPCQNINISGCDIKFARGIGTNRIGNTFFRNITITDCNIKASNEGLNIYDTLGVTVTGCTIKSTGKKDNYTSVGAYIGLDSKVSGSNKSKCKVVIKNNKITGYNAGLKICVPNKKSKFSSVVLKNNKLYSKKNKASALNTNAKYYSKITNSKNKLAKA